jgi:hypothetical protein
MGWTYTNRAKGEKNSDFFGKDFWSDGYEVLDTAQVGFRTVYQAVRRRSDSKVFAAVHLVNWVRDVRFNFGYKSMDESMGPGEATAPERILDLLSPVAELYPDGGDSFEWATEWRARCWARLARQGSLKLRTNTILALDTPIKWNGASLDRLLVENARRRIFRHLTGYGGRYKITRADLIAAGAQVVEPTEEEQKWLT